MISIQRQKIKKRSGHWISLFIILGIIYLLILSLNLSISSFRVLRLPFGMIMKDLFYSFGRVSSVTLAAWVIAILSGWLMNKIKAIKVVTLPVVNFIRNISPFAWFPFAIIWFGLGERPVIFILAVTLYFPALVSVTETFAEIGKEYLDEAKVCGANTWQLFYHIEFPLIVVPLINLLRIIWGLGWTIVIAAEMLGTATGLGFRLLDFRYLLFYEEMIVYLVLMGFIGVLIDHLLLSLTDRIRSRIVL